MPRTLHLHLSRRESQIVDALYALGEASVEEVRRRLGEPVSYDTVRLTLGALEKKGHVVHRVDGPRFVYRPVVEIEEARRSVLGHVLSTFFAGSAPKAVVTLLDLSEVSLSPEERAEIARRIDETVERSDAVTSVEKSEDPS